MLRLGTPVLAEEVDQGDLFGPHPHRVVPSGQRGRQSRTRGPRAAVVVPAGAVKDDHGTCSGGRG
jgi:hypothetical protein